MVHGGLLHALIIGGVGGVCNWLCGNVQAVMVGQMADSILVSPSPFEQGWTVQGLGLEGFGTKGLGTGRG